MDNPDDEPVHVITNKGRIPFSVGYLSRALLPLGITEDQAYKDANKIANYIQKNYSDNLHSQEIMDISHQWYKENRSSLSDRFSVISKDLDPLKPFVILLGGVTGVGKTTIAQILANRLSIKSIVGTDLIREVLRTTLSESLIPTLHQSSYKAHTKINSSFLPMLSKPIVGFEEQARSIMVGIEATIDQAIKDNEISIIEGVHLLPGILDDKLRNDPKILQIQLVLEDEDTHLSRLRVRERKPRRGTQYSKYFDEIREIQDYMVEQAKKHDIPIISLAEDEQALVNIIDLVWERFEDNNFNP